jgi:hypothetical protein
MITPFALLARICALLALPLICPVERDARWPGEAASKGKLIALFRLWAWANINKAD